MNQQHKGKKRAPATRKSAALAPALSMDADCVDAGALYTEVRAILDKARGELLAERLTGEFGKGFTATNLK